jgi:hypothetical protein
MKDSELRILFAAFAMLKMQWDDLDEDSLSAKECFAIADAMVKASKVSPADEVGIVAIKKKKVHA